jgi:hypothetical protein
MKRAGMTLLCALMVACCAGMVWAQGNPRGTSTITINGKTVSVEYGRPSLKGRTTDELLGRLSAGAAWRLGADTSTTFKTGTNLVFGGLTVPAGEYSIWMEREADNSWKLVFNKQHGQWGTEHDASQDLGSAPLQESKVTKPVETLTITLRKAGGGGTFTIEWGTLSVAASFKAK